MLECVLQHAHCGEPEGFAVGVAGVRFVEDGDDALDDVACVAGDDGLEENCKISL